MNTRTEILSAYMRQRIQRAENRGVVIGVIYSTAAMTVLAVAGRVLGIV